MAKLKIFIVTLFVIFLNITNLYSKEKDNKDEEKNEFWLSNLKNNNISLKVRAHDINYFPSYKPFKMFFSNKNNNFNGNISDIELGYIFNTKYVSYEGYLNSDFGIIHNNRWKSIEPNFIKVSGGLNIHPVIPKLNYVDPYIKLGAGYNHNENYSSSVLNLSKTNDLKVSRKHFGGLEGGVGLNLWILPNFGINLQGVYNHIFSNKTKSLLDFWKHDLGFVVKFGKIKKNIVKRDKNIIPISFNKKTSSPPVYKKTELSSLSPSQSQFPKINSDNPKVTDNKTEVNPKVTDNKTEVNPKVTDNKTEVNPNVTDNKTEVNPNVTDNKTEVNPKVTDNKTEVKVDINILDNKKDVIIKDKKVVKQKNDKHNKVEIKKICNSKMFFHPIIFKKGKINISLKSKKYINYVADKIKHCSSKKSKCYINGYADLSGKKFYNKIISLKRAKNVLKILNSKGVSNVIVKGLGSSKKGRCVEMILK